MDRRALFFLVAAAICLSMVAVADVQYRGLAFGLAVTYAVLAAASLLDSRSER